MLGTGKNYDLTASGEDHEDFDKWLQCYNQSDMDNMADGKKRMVWFKVMSPSVVSNVSYHSRAILVQWLPQMPRRNLLPKPKERLAPSQRKVKRLVKLIPRNRQ